VEALKTDWREAELTDRQRAILAYSEKLTRRQDELDEHDIEALRSHGLEDEEILAVVMLAGFFQLATRVADALGVELDAELARGTPAYEAFMARGG
jgi:uncharacterized peroxidase-related enzyme